MSTTFVNSDDKSLILRYTKDHLFVPLVKRLPPSLKPNVLTIMGFVAVLFFCYFTSIAIQGTNIAYLFAAASLLVYLVADNIDGMHARNTSQTSQLGGFLDQWLDGISFLIITMSLAEVVRITTGVYLIIMLVMAFVNYVLYCEQKQSGFFYKPSFGPNEFLLSISIVYVGIYFFHDAIITLYRYTGLHTSNILAYITIVICLFYLFQTLTRVKMNLFELFFAMVCHGILLVPFFMHRVHSSFLIALLMVIVNSIFIARILFSIYTLPLFSQPLASLTVLQVPETKPAGVRNKKGTPRDKLGN